MEPYQHAMQAFEVVTVKGSFARKELFAAASDTSRVNPKAYRELLAKLLDQGQLTMLFSGNIGKERAQRMALLAEEQLKITREQSAVTHTMNISVLKPNGAVEVRIPNPIPGDANHATLAAYQWGIPTLSDQLKVLLIGDIISDPVFDTLRTKHQL